MCKWVNEWVKTLKKIFQELNFNSNFFLPISLKPNGENLSYLKLEKIDALRFVINY